MFGRKTLEGHAQVLEMGPSARGARQTSKLDVEYRFGLKVSVPGQDDYVVEHTETVPHAKSPALGNVVPVSVSAKDRKKLQIVWSGVPDLADRARASAAAAQRGDAAGAAEALGFTLRDEP